MRARSYVVLLASVLSLPITSMASVRDVVQDSTGTGTTQEQAISEALLDAARRVNGAALTESTYMETTLSLVMSHRGDWMYQQKSSPVHVVESESKGLISRYQVLSVTPSGKQYKARVRAYIPKFQSDVADQFQRRVAVMPFRVPDSGFALTEFGSAADFTQQLADQIGVEISQTGKFSLLDRSHIAEMADESAFLNWDSPPQELARLGQKLGADFILVGRIYQAKEVASSSYYGTQAGTSKQIRLNWKLIEAATSKIAATGQVIQAQKDGTQSLVGQNGLAPNLIDVVARKIGGDVVQDVYPDYRPVAVTASPQAAVAPIPESELTPGSSSKPFSWQ